MKCVRLAIAQVNFCVGDIKGNTRKIKKFIKIARQKRSDIVCFPELSITGYPPEDLLLNRSFIEDNLEALDEIRKSTEAVVAVLGFVDIKDGIYNSAAVISDTKLMDVYHKQRLPNYGVFDEKRYFEKGSVTPVYKLGDIKFGVNICEDIWYPGNPTRDQAIAGGAELIINISSSPYHASKVQIREKMLQKRARDYKCNIAFANLVGGQDELVFDGHSCVIDNDAHVIARARGFEEQLLVCDIKINSLRNKNAGNIKHNVNISRNRVLSANIQQIDLRSKLKKNRVSLKEGLISDFYDEYEEIFNALVLSTRDYVNKNGFQKVLIGLSGGIDSSLVAAVAVEALGAKNVMGMSMPSQYSSKGSIKDAGALAKNLNINLKRVSIKKLFNEYNKTLSPLFRGTKVNITEENIQSRIRGNILMAVSNKFGWLVLTTANKSETSVGYSTLYGDMAGGFSVIKDVPKTLVYGLANYYNCSKGKQIIPSKVINKPPSAELRPDQLDTDSLPPYEVLDPILKAYIENDLDIEGIVSLGYKKRVVKKIIKMVDNNEYKRRQGPPGIKITPRAFGKDRRFPMTNRYHT